MVLDKENIMCSGLYRISRYALKIFGGTRVVNRTNKEDSTAPYSVAGGGDSMKEAYRETLL